MNIIHYLHRSLLFVPGSNARALEKARGLEADILILDCEDAVSPSDKSKARDQIKSALENEFENKKIVIRINGLDTAWGKDDLTAFLNADIHAILLPKAESVEQVEAIADRTDLPIWCNVETPIGVLRSSKLAAHEKCHAIVAGCNDLARGLKVKNDSERFGLMYSLAHMVLEARAYGKKIFDGTFIHLKDEKGFAEQCKQGKAMGFDGKTLIHPDQIPVCNDIFTPSKEEMARAREIVETYPKAESGVITIDGQMIEKLHYDEAVELVKIFSAIFPR